MKKCLSLLLAAFAVLSLLVPTSSAEAKPPGRRWSSLGVVGNPGDCYEVWVRNHWWHGWQVVHEPTPCPGRIISGGGTGVFFSEASAYVSLSKEGHVQHVFGAAVPFTLEPSTEYLGPVLNHGPEAASLVDLTADGEQLLGERIGPSAYPEQVWVLESHKTASFFTGPWQAALVTLSEDGASILAVHSVVSVEPIQQ